MPQALAALVAAPALLLAQASAPPPLTAAALLAGTAGQWCGSLEYRDYQSNKWVGLPMAVRVVAQPGASWPAACFVR